MKVSFQDYKKVNFSTLLLRFESLNMQNRSVRRGNTRTNTSDALPVLILLSSYTVLGFLHNLNLFTQTDVFLDSFETKVTFFLKEKRVYKSQSMHLRNMFTIFFNVFTPQRIVLFLVLAQNTSSRSLICRPTSQRS